VKDLNEKLGEKGFTIGNGYGKLKEQTFRIGHMGEWNTTTVKQVLDLIDEIWGLN
jgi:aspartate aminotransferase-like enzyme